MTNEEVKDILETTKTFFDSLPFENSQEVRNALDVAIEAISKKEEPKITAGFNKTPFDRVDIHDIYYHVTALGGVASIVEHTDYYDDERFVNCNYFDDKNFAEQVALHQLLYRKLLKFKLQRDNPITRDRCYYIYKDKSVCIKASNSNDKNCNCVYFNSHATANLAIEDVVIPFLKEYPDFIWNW